MVKLARVPERRLVRLPVEPAQPKVQVRVPVADRADIALEVAVVRNVEADLDQGSIRKDKEKLEGRTIVTNRRTSASVSWSPTRNSRPSSIFSRRSSDSKSAMTAVSYALWLLAKPALYTPSRHNSLAL